MPNRFRNMSRRRRIAIALLTTLLLVVVAAPFVMDREDRSLNTTARHTLEKRGSRFVELDNGTTHYEFGEQTGPVVVLIHGTSGPMTVWDATVPALTDAGYRVLRYDMFGRGYSDRVDASYNLDFFVRQLESLLRTLTIESKVTLVGSSLGAIVAAEMARQHPERVRSLVFVGPAGFALTVSSLAKLGQVPWLGDYLMRVVGDNKLAQHHRKYFVNPNNFESHHRAFAEQLRYRGSKAAILSTLRNTPLQSYLERYRELGTLSIPSLLIWGKEDKTFPYNNHKSFLAAVPHAVLVTVEAAAHLPMLERPDTVNTALVGFLQALEP